MTSSERPFAELPAALVQEVLDLTEGLGSELLASFQDLRANRIERRNVLVSQRVIRRDSDFEYVPIPTTCGIDGSYAIERLLATDLIAAAAVAVEGLTPPSETRYWPDPRHQVIVETESHHAESGTIARSIMIGMELQIATVAPHDVVFIDGSLTTPVIYFNQALTQVRQLSPLRITQRFISDIEEFLEAYRTILTAQRTDKTWVGIPKYTTRREFGNQFGWPLSYDDRAMLTNILEPGEYTAPIALDSPSQPWHLNTESVAQDDKRAIVKLVDDIVHELLEIRIIYYRPYSWMPALRIEVSRSVAETAGRLTPVIHAIKHQCGAAAMMEPYPLYMADRMVKSLSQAIPTFRQVTGQHMAETYDGDISDVFLGLHGYRTEEGR